MSNLKDLKILVVDDDETLLSVLSQVLNSEGYQVTAAANGEEAWEIFKKDPVPLVIADIVMPRMTGIELLIKIKEEYPDTQVIIMTSYASFDTATKALRYGAYDYLIKPFEDLDVISTAAKRAMEKIDRIFENQLEIEKLKKKVGDLEQSNTFLKNLAIRDGLTGLYNYRYFQEDLAYQVLRSGREKRIFSLMFISVDAFQRFGDTYGKVEADKLLLSMGQIFYNNIRKTDLLARYQKETFAVMLPRTTKNDTRKVAEKLCKLVADQPFPGREKQPAMQVTVSIGISTFSIDGNDGSTIIRYAEQALNQAQNSGGNTVCVTKTDTV
jgi:diguanylate cyclase (GGDEF)-like protein